MEGGLDFCYGLLELKQFLILSAKNVQFQLVLSVGHCFYQYSYQGGLSN